MNQFEASAPYSCMCVRTSFSMERILPRMSLRVLLSFLPSFFSFLPTFLPSFLLFQSVYLNQLNLTALLASSAWTADGVNFSGNFSALIPKIIGFIQNCSFEWTTQCLILFILFRRRSAKGGRWRSGRIYGWTVRHVRTHVCVRPSVRSSCLIGQQYRTGSSRVVYKPF